MHRGPELQSRQQREQNEAVLLAMLVATRLILAAAIVATLFYAIGCTPPLPPNPTPDPDPPGPTPVVVGDWYIVIEESADRTPGTAEAIRVIQSSGKNFRVYDDDSPDAAGYVAAIAGVARPALLILDDTGKKLDARPLPQSAAAMQALLGGSK